MKLSFSFIALLATLSVFSADDIAWNSEKGYDGWGGAVRMNMKQEGGSMKMTINGADPSLTISGIDVNPLD